MKHNDLTVARATIADIDSILRWRMAEAMSKSPEASVEAFDSLMRNTRQFLYDAMPANRFEACIAHSYCGMLGFGGITFYSTVPTLDNPHGLCAIIENVHVLPEVSGEGIEERIVSWLTHEAVRRGAKIVKNVEVPVEVLHEEIAV